MPLTVALQIIRTSWSKKSRGGRGAALRNAVPLALPFEAETGKFTAQNFRFGESNDFAMPTPAYRGIADREVRPIEADFQFTNSDISCGWNPKTANWFLRYSNVSQGVPNSDFFDAEGNPKPEQRELEVAVNSWARLRWMRRFSDFDSGNWWYEHTVANLAVSESPLHPNVFSRGAPAQEWSSLPILR